MKDLIMKQREFFNSHKSKDIDFRIKQLNILKNAIIEYEDNLFNALNKDLGKSKMEAYSSEIGFCLHEISSHIKNLRKWVTPKKVGTNRGMFPLGKSFILKEPFGTVLIIGPWNYPFALVITPLIGAISAGNCITIKPSEISLHTSAVIQKMIAKYFKKEYIQVILGDAEKTRELLKERFDYIFFTGSESVGRIVMEAASKNITPVTLELGGKSPCIVDKDCSLDKAALRIAYGKFLNAGQTCVAPDYLLIHKDIKSKFIDKLKEILVRFYGADIQKSKDYGRIINSKHFKRLASYLHDVNITHTGGQPNEKELFFPPTIVDQCENSRIMQEEVFGPILPMIEYSTPEEVENFINKRTKPLALYIFSNNNKFQNYILHRTSSGGVSINDTIFHIVNDDLPFGGVGNSGFGKYHGQASFDTFSNTKSVFKNTVLFDMPRFPPYNKYALAIMKKVFK